MWACWCNRQKCNLRWQNDSKHSLWYKILSVLWPTPWKQGIWRMVSQDCIWQNRLSSSRYGCNAVCLCCGHPRRRINNEWTTSYKLQLSTDGVTWNVFEEINTAKVWSATISNDYRTTKSPTQWVTKATFKIPPLRAGVWLLLFTSMITDRTVGQKVLWLICQNHCQVEETK